MKMIASTIRTRKYKYSSKYKPKIVVIDGSKIESIILDNEYGEEYEALKEAKEYVNKERHESN